MRSCSLHCRSFATSVFFKLKLLDRSPFFVVKDPGFSGREMAALVASKVFYHLEEPMTKVDLSSRMNRH